jgi:tripartite-type tricarboxylate transporter receptor subunit TctC
MIQKLVQCLLSTAMLVTANVGFAQDDRFPVKPIQVILPSSAGSQSDTLMRLLGTDVSKILGKAIVIVNKPSVAGTIGAEQARRAAPDGYTIFLGGNTVMAANVHLVNHAGERQPPRAGRAVRSADQVRVRAHCLRKSAAPGK